ncbi:hypothetical protein Goshw_001122 [Gossypium schwendimanii]|uniref:Uncharacterized protein n=1 Tax=Gossypium schwendimanii TaxID=34291 RepID=A0A7J9M9C4_GOSSC|nr:hypothetical protein [Gossypium schwendimanii]
MLYSTTHTSLSLSHLSCFSSISELPANSKEENSPQEQQQRSNAKNRPRPNLNVLLPQPRLPVNSNDDSDGEYETDENFKDEDSEDTKQEELVDGLFNNKSINSIIISFL